MTISSKNKIAETSAVPKKEAKKVEILEWSDEKVIELLDQQIELLIAGRSNYKTMQKIAAMFRIEPKEFRHKCLQNKSIAKYLKIFNGLYLEDIFKKAMDKGSINKTVENFIREELQAFTNTGTEQQITWVNDTKDTPILNVFGDEYEITVDKTEGNPKLLWELEQDAEE